MEEKEISSQNEELEETKTEEIADSEVLEAPEANEEAECAEEEEGEENKSPISSESFAKTLANPMFAVFARGRGGSIEEAVRAFEEMLIAGRASLSEEELMKMIEEGRR